jgi:phage terminase large subunit
MDYRIEKAKAAAIAARRANEEAHFKSIVGKGYDAFLNNKTFYEVVKGGRASKKSTTMALRTIRRIMTVPDANMVVVRSVYGTHKNSTFAELKRAARRLNVYEEWKFTENPLQATYLKTGQKILFYGFDDPMKLTSMAVDVGYLCWAWFEEVFEIENEEDFNTFVEGIRGEMPAHLWKQVTLTYNPWIDSHWTKTRFWEGECPPDTFRDTTTHKCNEFLDEADHDRIEQLQYTNPERYKVVGLGEYGLPGGTYFEEFRPDIHVISPFIIPEDWKRYTTKDYGLDMLANYWIAVDFKGIAYVYKELHESDLIISEAAKRIDEINNGEKIYEKFAPPDLWNRRQETGKSAAEIFGEHGEWLTKANNDRLHGCYNMKEWLKPYEERDEQTGETIMTANIKIFNNCYNLINSLKSIQKDEKDPNVYATEPHHLTHSVDAIRYWTAGRPTPTRIMKPEPQKKLIDRLQPKPQIKM